MTTINFADPFSDVVEEVTIVRYRKHRTRIAMKELLQPQHRFGIQVVGRLVQKKQVRRFKQKLAQRNATALATGKHLYRSIGVGALQSIHCLGKLTVQIPSVCSIDIVLKRAHFFHQSIEIGIRIGHFRTDGIEALNFSKHVGKCHTDILDYRSLFVERGLLLKNTNRVAGSKACVARGNLFKTSHNLQQGRLAHAIRAYYADFCARVKRKRHVVQDNLVAVSFARLIHLINEFSHKDSFHEGCWWPAMCILIFIILYSINFTKAHL